ncbi:hypothetical protein [Roseivivax marinus]|jgi:hypothetical protein|uniref:hypothetical protein n=1 Tax=Roseivivax marinus TaxID=1379903 RepID=UPI00273D8B82|nr:hypothetical protein [Roseivivax marinus]
MSRFSLFAGAAALILGAHAAPVAAQSSNAARYLLQQELSKACEFSGGGGQISNGGLMERDFDGDGRDDLLIAHEAIRCGGSGRSSFCGMQVCSVRIWLRRGDLLTLEKDMLGGGIEVSGGTPPTISGYGHGGGQWSMRWSGGAFR